MTRQRTLPLDLKSKPWLRRQTLTCPIRVERFAYVGRFMSSEFPFIPNRGYRRKAHGANRIVGTIGIVSMWEIWFQWCGHLSPSRLLINFGQNIEIREARLSNFAHQMTKKPRISRRQRGKQRLSNVSRFLGEINTDFTLLQRVGLFNFAQTPNSPSHGGFLIWRAE